MEASSRSFRPDMTADWKAFGEAMPHGAKVLAPWAATHAFVFWAPSASYINVLDPLFMSVRDPEAYRLYVDLLEGREPDIPLVARSRFDSEFYADDGQYPLAKERLARDPRVVPLHDGITFLYQLAEGRNGNFLLDWKVLPAGTPVPPPLELITDRATPSYPRADTARERALEGYVDGRRLTHTTGCITFARAHEIDRPRSLALELSPYGRAEVYVDDGLAAVIPPRGAYLGRGVVLPLTLQPGWRRLAVRTCFSGSQMGFYALVRAGERALSAQF
jgi:hypothetical protein